jgi:hypothetical protein
VNRRADRDETIFAPREVIGKQGSARNEASKRRGPPMAAHEDLISFICLGVMVVGIAVLGSGLAALMLT